MSNRDHPSRLSSEEFICQSFGIKTLKEICKSLGINGDLNDPRRKWLDREYPYGAFLDAINLGFSEWDALYKASKKTPDYIEAIRDVQTLSSSHQY